MCVHLLLRAVGFVFQKPFALSLFKPLYLGNKVSLLSSTQRGIPSNTFQFT